MIVRQMNDIINTPTGDELRGLMVVMVVVVVEENNSESNYGNEAVISKLRGRPLTMMNDWKSRNEGKRERFT